MDESEKLGALKKAYAEIILNTAKEAAARIMVTERKAMRFQHELVAAKEETLRMLNRIKHIMDSKIAEVKTRSLCQQQKIDELEAQLQEAEDIVRDLRAELGEVQDELETVAANQLPSNFGNSDFASLMMMNKEPELSRKCCTQRIRASETTFLDREVLRSGNLHDQVMERCQTFALSSSKTFSHPVKTASIQYREDPSKINENEVDSVKNEAIVGEDKEASIIELVLDVDNFQSEENTSDFDSEAPKDPESHSLSVYPSFTAANDKTSGFVEVSGGVLKSCNTRQLNEDDNTSTDIVELNTQGIGSTENSVNLIRKVNLQAENVTLKSDVTMFDITQNGVPSQPAINRIIKYTFQRKRKKESLSSADRSTSFKEKNQKRIKEENQGSLDSQKSSLTNESFRDSRRLSQACQLISLSEKKLWQ